MPDAHGVHIRQLCYRLNGRSLLHDIHLDLPARRVSVLLGPNGAGKTTLLRLVAGLMPPASGAVRIAGQCVERLPPGERARLIVWVPQHVPAGIPLSVTEFVMLGRVPHLGPFHRPGQTDRQAVADAIATVELDTMAHTRLNALSGGERQRAAIARALAQQAPILLLDEPTNHLDLRHQHRLQQLLHTLSRQGKTVVQVLHDLTLAANYSDHVALLNTGQLVAAGTPADVLTPERLLAVYRWPVQLHVQDKTWHVETGRRTTGEQGGRRAYFAYAPSPHLTLVR